MNKKKKSRKRRRGNPGDTQKYFNNLPYWIPLPEVYDPDIRLDFGRDDDSPEQRLWLQVVVQMLRDACSRKVINDMTTPEYVQTHDFSLVCEFANLDEGYIRKKALDFYNSGLESRMLIRKRIMKK